MVGLAAAPAPADRPRGGRDTAAADGTAAGRGAAEEGRRWLKVCRMPEGGWDGGAALLGWAGAARWGEVWVAMSASGLERASIQRATQIHNGAVHQASGLMQCKPRERLGSRPRFPPLTSSHSCRRLGQQVLQPRCNAVGRAADGVHRLRQVGRQVLGLKPAACTTIQHMARAGSMQHIEGEGSGPQHPPGAAARRWRRCRPEPCRAPPGHLSSCPERPPGQTACRSSRPACCCAGEGRERQNRVPGSMHRRGCRAIRQALWQLPQPGQHPREAAQCGLVVQLAALVLELVRQLARHGSHGLRDQGRRGREQ